MLAALFVIAAPTLPEIVARAAAVLSHAPTHAVCRAETEQMRLGKRGAIEMRERAAFVRTFLGAAFSDSAPTLRWKDEQALSPEQVSTINGRAMNKNGETLDEQLRSPLVHPERHDFERVGEDTLWGHAVYVVKVTAKTPQGANGTVWIDATSFVERKGELTPQQAPAHIDSLSWQEQFEALADGSVVRSLIHIEGRGHFLFFTAATRFNERLFECAVNP